MLESALKTWNYSRKETKVDYRTGFRRQTR